jgi:hypothetical protein
MRKGANAGLGALGLVLLGVLLVLTILPSRPFLSSSQAAAPSQPIAFSHKIHAGQFKIDCQYCHADARRSEYAGIPSVTRCMGCHKITAADRPEIKKLAEYLAKQEPIPWVRVYKVPEFTYFPHKPHVRAGVRCQTCHGPVETMDVVSAKTGQSLLNDVLNLTTLPVNPPRLTMGWCIECHRELNQTQGKKAPLDCFACHH